MPDKLPQRKLIRLKEFDYSNAGAYFVTVCTHNKEHIFSQISCTISGDACTVSHNEPQAVNNIVGAIHESPENILNEYGIYLDNLIKQLHLRFNITIDKYVIMPNHVHLIIVINDDERAIRESPLQNQRSILSKVIGYIKMNVSKKIHEFYPDKKIWQRSYNDHVIRNEMDYREIWNYIDTNVIRWYNKYICK